MESDARRAGWSGTLSQSGLLVGKALSVGKTLSAGTLGRENFGATKGVLF